MELKYLTKITEEHRDWIRKAATELELTQPQIVQIALDQLMANNWETAKGRIIAQRAGKEIEGIEEKINDLKRQKEELENRIHATV